MTAQIHDSVDYGGATYALSAVHGAPLFEPEAHGLRPVMMHTACYRGFYVTYALSGDELVLRELTLRLDPADLKARGGAYPVFQGVASRKGRDGAHTYRNLSLPVPFTGGLLIADGFVRELYVHMGFHPAWKYERVHELTFRAGHLDEARDRSDVAAAVREKMRAQADAARDPAELTAWIASTFDMHWPW